METMTVKLNNKWLKPNVGDRLCLVDGDEWSVISVEEVDEVDFRYLVEVRKDS